MKKWINNGLWCFGGVIMGAGMAGTTEPTEAIKEPVAVVAKAEPVKTVEAKPIEAPVKPVKVVEPKKVVVAPVEPKKPVEAKVIAPEGIRSADAKRICNEAIKSETEHFNKVDINYISDSAFLKDATGKATASIGFTVENEAGVEVPFIGYCYFNADESLRTFEIQKG